MSNFVGNVDSVSPAGNISGWAIDTNNFSSPAHLVVLLDGQVAATVVCSGHRPDVESAGFKTSTAGFVAIVSGFRDGVERKISFRSFDGGEEFVLDGQKSIRLETPIAGEFALDREKFELTGWVYASGSRKRPMFIEILVDEVSTWVIDVLSNERRQESNERVSFRFSLPRAFMEDIKVKDIQARVVGTNEYLSGGPIPSRVTKLSGKLEHLIGRRITGWAFDVGLSLPPILEVYIDDHCVSQFLAGSHRENVECSTTPTNMSFDVVLPVDLVLSSKHIGVRFEDGRNIPGSPKTVSLIDTELIKIESIMNSEQPNIFITPDNITAVVDIIASILTLYSDDQRYESHRRQASNIAKKLLVEAMDWKDTGKSFELIKLFSMLNVTLCETVEEFTKLVEICERTIIGKAEFASLINLQIQRTDPFGGIYLSWAYLRENKTDDAIDKIFQSWYVADNTVKTMVAAAGRVLLIRYGLDKEARMLLLSSMEGNQGGNQKV